MNVAIRDGATQLVLLVLPLLVCVDAVAGTAQALRSRATRRATIATCGAVVAALILRFLIVPRSFTHDNFHAVELVDTMLGIGEPDHRLGAYGPFGFAVLGALADLFGGSVHALLDANLVIGTLALAATGVYLARVLGISAIAPYVVLGGALFPPLAGIARSEDLHGFSTLFLALGLASIDRHVETGLRREAGLGYLSVAISLWSRQTYFPMVPVFAVLLVVAARPEHRRRATGAAAGLLGLAVARAAYSALQASDAPSFEAAGFAMSRPDIVLRLVSDHWALSPWRLGWLVVPTTCVGLGLVPRRQVAWAYGGAIAAAFLVTLTFHRHNPGSELCMRTPLSVLLLGPLAVVAERAVEVWNLGLPRSLRAVCVCVALTFGTCLQAEGRAALRYQAIDYQEFEYLSSIAPRLPSRFVLVVPPHEDGRASRGPSTTPFVLAGRVVTVLASAPPTSSDPVLFFEGLDCWAYSLEELAGLTDWDRRHYFQSERARPVVEAYFRPLERSGFVVPSERRSTCAAWVAASDPMPLPEGRLTPHQVHPYAVFSDLATRPMRMRIVGTRSARPGDTTPPSTTVRETSGTLSR